MRSLNFRDFVLWPIAYKLGLDPTTNFEQKQAFAIGTYINSWVRRLFTSADWPEWEVIESFTPINHFVPYQPVFQSAVQPKRYIGKVLSVHLLDPRTTNDPVDIAFTESEQGIHVGYDHGTTVWIKYLPGCPVFTAEEWNPNKTFRRGEVTYSSTTGECYTSKVNGNRGHDPALDTTIGKRPLTPQLAQKFIPADPGFDATNKIMSIFLVTTGGLSISGLPPSGQKFTITVVDSIGALLATAAETANGIATLAQILDALGATLSANVNLATFTITTDLDNLKMTFEDASDFKVSGNFSPSGSATYALVVNQSKSFVPVFPPVDITPQLVTLALTDTDVRPNAEYIVSFTDPDGVEHQAIYTASKNDSASQILAGLIAAIQAANDTVLASVGASLDAATATITFSSEQELGIDASVAIAGSLWWNIEPFPFELIDAVVRGANADTLKEWGQSDKGALEEQGVPQETSTRLGVGSAQQFTQVSERQRVKSRYVVR